MMWQFSTVPGFQQSVYASLQGRVYKVVAFLSPPPLFVVLGSSDFPSLRRSPIRRSQTVLFFFFFFFFFFLKIGGFILPFVFGEMMAEEIEKEMSGVSTSESHPLYHPDNKPRIPPEAKNILHQLASAWSDVMDATAIQVVQLKGAMTNEVYEITWETEESMPPRKVLVRIYGEGVDVLFDRTDEILTFETMSRHGQGPSLLGLFSNGRVEEFINARTLSASDLRDPKTSALIAAKLREFHCLKMPCSENGMLWGRLRNWLKVAMSLCSSADVMEFSLDCMEGEIATLQKKLVGENQKIGFCHNDLQYGNIMMDDETQVITIIDYEYASHNPVAYDIANHFCEMAADYHTETPHILDYNKYPDLEERKRFVLAYLGFSDENSSNNAEVEELLEDVEKFTLANHLYWFLWGIISDCLNEIDFEYKEYSRQRFHQYWLKKPLLLKG